MSVSSDNETGEHAEKDDVADAIAAVIVIVILVASAVFWVAQH